MQVLVDKHLTSLVGAHTHPRAPVHTLRSTGTVMVFVRQAQLDHKAAKLAALLLHSWNLLLNNVG